MVKIVVIGIVGLLIGVPLMLMMLGTVFVAGAATGFGRLGDVDRLRIEAAVSREDITFGGDIKAVLKTFRQLRSIAASPGDSRVNNRVLSVAVVTLPEPEPAKPESKSKWSWFGASSPKTVQTLAIDFKFAREGAVLVIPDRPVRFVAKNADDTHRAKLAVEGPAIFDLADAPQGLLAGFKMTSFGAANATSPRDYEGNATLHHTVRFCRSLAQWMRHYQVSPDEIRIWKFDAPSVLSVAGAQLTSEGGTQSRPTYLVDHCRRYN